MQTRDIGGRSCYSRGRARHAGKMEGVSSSNRGGGRGPNFGMGRERMCRALCVSSDYASGFERKVDVTHSVHNGALMPSENSSSSLRWKRVLLKVSGEALQGDGEFGIDPEMVRRVANEVAATTMRGLQVAIVVGGGNFFRGRDAWEGLDQATADYIGMLATAMNAISLQSTLEGLGVPVRVQTAISMKEVAEPYIRRRAIRHLEKGRVVIFGGGTGNPFFTTDTAAALRAAEIDAQAVLKATKVDGVYDEDPKKNPNAKMHSSLTYRDVISKDLAVMDETAITLCKENDIPVIVFNIMKEGNVTRALCGDSIGTEVSTNE